MQTDRSAGAADARSCQRLTQNSHGSVLTWSGNATFVRAAPGPGANGFFNLLTSQYTVIASGRDGSGATACRQSGTKTVTGGSGDIDVSGEPPSYGAPYGYAGELFGQLPEAQIMRVTLHDCPTGAEEWEGREVATSIAMAPWDTRGVQISADGHRFAGSVTETSGQFSATWDWDMTGTP